MIRIGALTMSAHPATLAPPVSQNGRGLSSSGEHSTPPDEARRALKVFYSRRTHTDSAIKTLEAIAQGEAPPAEKKWGVCGV